MANGITNKRLFITGGAGFIGSHLVEKLIEHNEVIIYDNFCRNALQYTELAKNPNVKIIEGDVLDQQKLKWEMKNVDICIHAAAIAGIYSVVKNSTLTMKVNFIGTYNALEAAVKNNVKRFIDFSTSEVYGPFIFRGKETDATTLGPVGERRWVYAVSKLAGEHFAHTYAEDYDIEIITIRPFNIYGPRQIGEGAIQQMVRRALRNEDIIVYNDGTQIRAWCYISDFIEALYNALYLEEAKNQLFNIGNPQTTITVLGLAQKIMQMTQSTANIIFKVHPGPEVEMRVPDISKACSLLHFTPKINLEDGLKSTIEWYKSFLVA
ncbi:MAG: epimerase [Candidatus Fischerbacteria bacterium RBG_13_37_8]|uniref:Epimerase n=1 Tax=Candidatus Fischerbacteria bacterium RBG_13_37_8 TaxID=1817863 RepID=A0A1F5VWF7_9BACT|nr:MAG: epimerase [Candidatus Fischerbacteria bacterium RBG_13_37_8]